MLTVHTPTNVTLKLHSGAKKAFAIYIYAINKKKKIRLHYIDALIYRLNTIDNFLIYRKVEF